MKMMLWQDTPGSSCLRHTQWIAATVLTLTIGLSTQVVLAQATLEVRVSHDDDDAEENSSTGEVYLESSDLELANDADYDTVGMRFRNLTIPQGAAITNAYIQFKVDETSSGSVSLTIHGQDIDDAATFSSSSNYNISGRTKTSASVAWSPPAWTSAGAAGVDQQTPDLTAIVQEIVNRSGWTSGNDMVMIITGTGTRTAESHDGDSSGAPLLHVEYTTGGGGDDDDSGGGTITKIQLSTVGAATLGGLAFQDEDIVEYCADIDTATLYLDGSADITDGNDINAFFVRDNGNIVISCVGNFTIDGVTYGDDDLVDYDPSTGTATLLFDGGALFSSSSEDINAVHILDNGNIILSTVGNATLGGLTFGDDDLVEYNPGTDTATMYFDGGNLFSATDEDVDAVYVQDDGKIILSTVGNATLGGLSFGDDDLVEYDPVSDTAAMYFDGGNLFSNSDEDIDGVHIRYLMPGVPGYWKLDETTGTTASDSLGNGWDGTLTGFSFDTGTTTACATARGLAFDGANDHIIVTGNKGVTGAAARTVTAWIKASTTGAIISWGANSAGQQWSVRVQDDVETEGALRVDVGTGYVVGSTDLRDDKWHFIAAVLPDTLDNATDILLYVDGDLETISASQAQAINTASSADVTIGSDHSSRYFAGSMAEVQLHDRDLSIAEINLLYGRVAYWRFDESNPATVAVDATGNGYDVTLNGDAAWVNGQIAGALTFDGDGDYAVTSTDFDPPDDGAIAFWMKVPGSPSSRGRIFGTSNDWEVRHETSGVLIFDINGGGSGTMETSIALDSPNRWYHVVLNYSATSDEYELYIDGTLHTSGTNNMSGQGAALLSIGRRTGSNDYWNGTIDDLMIYSRWLCSDEITQLSTAEPSPGVRILKWVEVK